MAAECIVCDGLGCEHCPNVEPIIREHVSPGARTAVAVLMLHQAVGGLCDGGLDPSLIRLEVELAMDAWATTRGEEPA